MCHAKCIVIKWCATRRAFDKYNHQIIIKRSFVFGLIVQILCVRVGVCKCECECKIEAIHFIWHGFYSGRCDSSKWGYNWPCFVGSSHAEVRIFFIVVIALCLLYLLPLLLLFQRISQSSNSLISGFCAINKNAEMKTAHSVIVGGAATARYFWHFVLRCEL